MKVDIGAVFEQIVAAYARLPLAQKLAIPLLLVGSVATIVFVSRWASRPDYGVLFSGLEEADSAAVVETLKERKIGFRIRDDGRTIDVSPPDAVNELRLELAAAGLPKGGKVGFEVFDTTSLGQSSFIEKIKFVRAVQGELERTITALDAVKSVRVHITLPDKSVFVKRDVPPTASVLVRLKTGAELTPKQVKGIAHLVANSVERLTPENVSIMDTKGTVLNDQSDKAEQLNGADTNRLDYQRALEAAYVKRIESMLSEVLGPGRVVARVSAEIDFSRYEKQEEEYDPAGQVARSERTMEELAGGAGAEGGVPGVLSNLTNQPGVLAPPDSSKSGNVRKESVRNYEVSRAVSKTTSAAGKIQRLTAAVLVDGEYVAGQGAEKAYQELAPEKLAKIEQVVKQAIGFDATRGDLVTVENMQFFEPDAAIEQALAADSTMEMVYWLVPWLLAAIFVALLFFLVIVPMMRFLLKPTEAEADLSRLLPSGLSELEAELEVERQKIGLTPEIEGPVVDIEELEELLSHNHRLVKDNPQQAALLIRYWLNEGHL